jgi:hypothetical protein
VQLLKNFRAIYGARRFITVFTRAIHWSLSSARSVQSIQPHPLSKSNIPWPKSHVRFLLLGSFIQRIHPGLRPFVTFRNKFIFYSELLAQRPTPKLEGHPLSAVRDCLFNIFAATLHIWKPSPPSATGGRAMPW